MQSFTASHQVWSMLEIRTDILDYLSPSGHFKLMTTSQDMFQECVKRMWRSVTEKDCKAMRKAKPPLVSFERETAGASRLMDFV
jgi:hypothetical protein